MNQVKIYSPEGKVEILKEKEKPEPSKNVAVKVYWEDKPINLSEKKKEPETEKHNPIQLQEDAKTAIANITIIQGTIFRQRNVLCNKNVDLPETALHSERKAIIDQIHSLTQEYNTLAETKRKIQKLGKVEDNAPKNPFASLDKVELYKKKQNLLKNLSKARIKLKKDQLQPEKVAKHKIAIARLEAQTLEIESLLKGK